MAWENVLFDGFDAKTLGKWDATVSAVIGQGGRRSGFGVTYSFNTCNITKNIQNKKCLILGVAYTLPGVSYRIDFYDGANIQFFCEITSTLINIKNNAGTVLGTTNISIPSYSFRYIEIGANIDNSGTCIVKMDGITLLTIDADIQYTVNSYCSAIKITITVSYYNGYIDDVYIRQADTWDTNGFLGDIRIDAIVPTADTLKEFTPSTGTVNAECLDEIPPSETDYVTSGGYGSKDIYRFANTLDLPGQILAIQQSSLCKKPTSGVSQGLKHIIRMNVTDYEKDAFIPDSTSKFYTNIWDTNPDNDNLWDIDDINSLDAGLLAES